MVTGDVVPADRVATMILGDPGVAGELRAVVLDRGWPGGPLLARRAVEERLAGGACPAGADYRLAAGAGYARDADLMRAMVGIVRLLERHESRWQHRYDGYVYLGADEIRARVRDGTLGLGTVRRGIDGARILTGGHAAASPLNGTSAVLAVTRAGFEQLTGWDSLAAAAEWVRGRLPPAARWPGFAAGLRGAHPGVGAAVPAGLDAVATALPGYVFTTDLRGEIFAAARVLHVHGVTVNAATVAAGTGRCCLRASSWAREMPGGPRAPLAGDYVRRLAGTEVTSATAERQSAGSPAPASPLRPRAAPCACHGRRRR